MSFENLLALLKCNKAVLFIIGENHLEDEEYFHTWQNYLKNNPDATPPTLKDFLQKSDHQIAPDSKKETALAPTLNDTNKNISERCDDDASDNSISEDDTDIILPHLTTMYDAPPFNCASADAGENISQLGQIASLTMQRDPRIIHLREWHISEGSTPTKLSIDDDSIIIRLNIARAAALLKLAENFFRNSTITITTNPQTIRDFITQYLDYLTIECKETFNDDEQSHIKNLLPPKIKEDISWIAQTILCIATGKIQRTHVLTSPQSAVTPSEQEILQTLFKHYHTLGTQFRDESFCKILRRLLHIAGSPGYQGPKALIFSVGEAHIPGIHQTLLQKSAENIYIVSSKEEFYKIHHFSVQEAILKIVEHAPPPPAISENLHQKIVEYGESPEGLQTLKENDPSLFKELELKHFFTSISIRNLLQQEKPLFNMTNHALLFQPCDRKRHTSPQITTKREINKRTRGLTL